MVSFSSQTLRSAFYIFIFKPGTSLDFFILSIIHLVHMCFFFDDFVPCCGMPAVVAGLNHFFTYLDYIFLLILVVVCLVNDFDHWLLSLLY